MYMFWYFLDSSIYSRPRLSVQVGALQIMNHTDDRIMRSFDIWNNLTFGISCQMLHCDCDYNVYGRIWDYEVSLVCVLCVCARDIVDILLCGKH